MTRALVRKELSQHGWLLAVATVLALVGYGAVAYSGYLREDDGSAFESLRAFLLVMLGPVSLLLGHRLVVVEYQARTQLFLEALPVSRVGMVAVKYVLGLGVLGIIILVAFGASCGLALKHELPPVRLLGIIACRAFSAAWAVYNVCFAMGFLGRYRVAAYVALLVTTFAVSELSNLELNRFGPLALLDERFAYEGDRMPTRALLETLCLAGAFLGMAVALGLVREGSVASLLAEKMSHREKLFVAALIVGGVFLVSVLSERQKKKPFDIVGGVEATRPGITVKVESDSSGGDASARGAAAGLADQLAGIREFLGVDALPPVFLMRRGDLDPDHFVRGESKESSGVRVHANLALNWNQPPFVSWLVREVLIESTGGRAEFERRLWILDGFSLYWLGQENAAGPLVDDRAWALRALYGVEAGFAPRDLAAWLTFRERVGGDIAAGVAWSGLKTLARRSSPEHCRQFLRAVLGNPSPRDVRALFRERRLTLQSLLREHAGLSEDAFFAAWREELDLARRNLATELARVPRLKGEVSFVPISKDSRRIAYQLSVEPVPAGDFDYVFQHHLLPPFDEPVRPPDLRREQHRYALARSAELPESVSRGARLYSTFSLKVPALGCEVISGWTRQDVP